MIMTAIGKGAASTKAAGLWSLAIFALVMPTFVEGQVHDRVGTQAMLLADAGLGVVGFGVLLVASRFLKFRADVLAARPI
jgi:Zn-dependent protease with chaperone function